MDPRPAAVPGHDLDQRCGAPDGEGTVGVRKVVRVLLSATLADLRLIVGITGVEGGR